MFKFLCRREIHYLLFLIPLVWAFDTVSGMNLLVSVTGLLRFLDTAFIPKAKARSGRNYWQQFSSCRTGYSGPLEDKMKLHMHTTKKGRYLIIKQMLMLPLQYQSICIYIPIHMSAHSYFENI